MRTHPSRQQCDSGRAGAQSSEHASRSILTSATRSRRRSALRGRFRRSIGLPWHLSAHDRAGRGGVPLSTRTVTARWTPASASACADRARARRGGKRRVRPGSSRFDFVGLEAGFSHEPVARLAAELGRSCPCRIRASRSPRAAARPTTSPSSSRAPTGACAGRGDASRSCPVRIPTTERVSVASRRRAVTPFRAPFEPVVPGFVRTSQPSPGRCGYCSFGETCTCACADVVARVIGREGPAPSRHSSASRSRSSAPSRCRTPDYWRRIREICDSYGVLLIADEVVTGFGRTGHMFASSHWGIEPDMVTMAKGLTSGYVPMGATALGPRVQEVLGGTSLMHINTYAGHPVACAGRAGCARHHAERGSGRRTPPRSSRRARGLRSTSRSGERQQRADSALGLMTGIEVAVDEPAADLALQIRHALYARGVAVRDRRGRRRRGRALLSAVDR